MEVADLVHGGALLIRKPIGVTSFDVIERLRRALGKALSLPWRKLPSLGHGGTLDPFASGLLVVGVGQAVKLLQFLLHAEKEYLAKVRFGQTTIPGDPTEPPSEQCEKIPASLDELQALAHTFQAKPYWQTPPMHSAKKRNGQPLYELARQGLEVQRDAILCHLPHLEFLDYAAPVATLRVSCSSGTYIRTLAQDLGKATSSLGMLDALHRTRAGKISDEFALELSDVERIIEEMPRSQSPQCASLFGKAWIPFDELLEKATDLTHVEVLDSEWSQLKLGQQKPLPGIAARAGKLQVSQAPSRLVLKFENRMRGILLQEALNPWRIERIFLN